MTDWERRTVPRRSTNATNQLGGSCPAIEYNILDGWMSEPSGICCLACHTFPSRDQGSHLEQQFLAYQSIAKDNKDTRYHTYHVAGASQPASQEYPSQGLPWKVRQRSQA